MSEIPTSYQEETFVRTRNKKWDTMLDVMVMRILYRAEKRHILHGNFKLSLPFVQISCLAGLWCWMSLLTIF